jgi:hypothetical protein
MELDEILEQHFSVNQVTKQLGKSRRTTIKLVDEHMPEVRTLGQKRSRNVVLRRQYLTRMMPASVVRKIAAELLGAR